MWGRITGRKLFNQLRAWSPLKFGFGTAEVVELTDVQVAALAWLMQIHHFDAIARAFGPDRVIVLDSTTLLADPAAALDKAQSLFGLDLDRDQVEAIATGDAFAKHSKFSDRDYSAEAREQDHRAVTDAHSEELSMVVQWIKAVADSVGAPLKPGE
jgi:hypothetical protein